MVFYIKKSLHVVKSLKKYANKGMNWSALILFFYLLFLMSFIFTGCGADEGPVEGDRCEIELYPTDSGQSLDRLSSWTYAGTIKNRPCRSLLAFGMGGVRFTYKKTSGSFSGIFYVRSLSFGDVKRLAYDRGEIDLSARSELEKTYLASYKNSERDNLLAKEHELPWAGAHALGEESPVWLEADLAEGLPSKITLIIEVLKR